MTKIDALKFLKETQVIKYNHISKPIFSNVLETRSLPSLTSSIVFAGTAISTFISDFHKTIDMNYFQLGTNPETKEPYKADVFQTAAAANIFADNDVLVTAPTGTGKTAIAEYAITKNLFDGKKTFYTTPLKALSNEKFNSFKKVYGEENVGLITGDTKINTQAPIIVMTTEVYRNMAASNNFNNSDNNKGIPKDLKTVIFDELQYLGDVDRGGIWEQSIMFTPDNVQILSLSATIGNNKEINNWIGSIRNKEHVITETPDKSYKPTNIKKNSSVLINVPSENRHVPLNFEITHVAPQINMPRCGSKSQKIKAKKESAKKAQTIYAKIDDIGFKKITKELFINDKLPAIYFIFSKKDSRHFLKHLSMESEILTNQKEQDEIAEIIKRYIDEGVYLGEKLDTEALIKGYAVHNAGLLPSQKRLIEELFQKKLVKIVIATETLSAGINMPAKTVVISSPRKPSSTPDGGDDHKRNLTPNEFHQMAGRAGRRGIDTVGYCYAFSCNPVQHDFFDKLIQSSANDLDSNLVIDYSFICNYNKAFQGDVELEHILSKSLYSFDNNTKKASKIKLKALLDNYYVKEDILIKNNYMDKNGNLSLKGEMLKNLNGYEQIPIINLIANKSFKDLTPVQLAGIIGGLANIESDTKDNEFLDKPFTLKKVDDTTLEAAANIAYSEIKSHQRNISKLYPDRILILEPKAISEIYNWAKMNSQNSNSIANWKKMYQDDDKMAFNDEGTLFKEIRNTADLLKQLVEVCNEGFSEADNSNDQDYFKIMAEKFQKTLDIIQRKPANDEF